MLISQIRFMLQRSSFFYEDYIWSMEFFDLIEDGRKNDEDIILVEVAIDNFIQFRCAVSRKDRNAERNWDSVIDFVNLSK